LIGMLDAARSRRDAPRALSHRVSRRPRRTAFRANKPHFASVRPGQLGDGGV